MPLTRMVFTSTGAFPVSATRLFAVVSGPLAVKFVVSAAANLERMLERAPIRATEGRRLVNLLHRAVSEVRGKQLLSGPPGAAVAEDNIVVPDEQGPLSVHRLVAIHVLFILAAKSIPITDGMFDRKRPHPLLHVRDGLQARRIGRVRRIDQREDIGVVVGGAVDGARQ